MWANFYIWTDAGTAASLAGERQCRRGEDTADYYYSSYSDTVSAEIGLDGQFGDKPVTIRANVENPTDRISGH